MRSAKHQQQRASSTSASTSQQITSSEHASLKEDKEGAAQAARMDAAVDAFQAAMHASINRRFAEAIQRILARKGGVDILS